MTDNGRTRALEALEGILPGGAVCCDDETLAAYSSASYPVTGHKPFCSARPAGPEDVQSIARLALREGINLVPVSSGGPHVKGGSRPESEESLMVDLSGMREVVRMDRRNRVAVIEPGVTFGELCDRAAESGLRPMLPLLPRPSKSVIASYLEGEPTTIPKYHWDTTDPMLCVEVIFGTGDLFRTGSAAGPGSLEDQWALGNAQKNPMGPAATDLLKLVQGAQGTMGIVTWASVGLELKPSVRRFGFATSDRIEPLLEMALEMCRKKLGDELLLLDGVDLALVSACSANGEPAPAESLSRYTLAYAVAGYPGYLPGERAAYQRRDIDAIARRIGVRVEEQSGGLSGDAFGRLLDGPCPGAHWKSRLAGACQEVFFLTVIDRVPDFIDAMEAVSSRFSLAPGTVGTYIQPVRQGRSCHLEFDIFYDPSDEAARERAHRAAAEACGAMAGMGAFFSRPYEPWVGVSYEGCPDTVDALRRVKGVFDPQNIMNRGKLCFEGGVVRGAL